MKHRNVLLLVAFLLVAAPAFGGDGLGEKRGRNRCTLDGSWFVYPVEETFGTLGPYTINTTMYSPHDGVASVVWSGTDPTAWGACPDAVELTIAQGAIARTGPRSFELTVISLAKDAAGAVVCIGKSNLWIDLERGCDSGFMNGKLEFYFGDDDPFAAEPYLCFPETESDYPISRMVAGPPHSSCP